MFAAEASLLKRKTSREIIKKICLPGDTRSGKTELVKLYAHSMFDDKYLTTIGAHVTKESITYDRTLAGARWEVPLTLLSWDIFGKRQFTKLHHL